MARGNWVSVTGALVLAVSTAAMAEGGPQIKREIQIDSASGESVQFAGALLIVGEEGNELMRFDQATPLKVAVGSSGFSGVFKVEDRGQRLRIQVYETRGEEIRQTFSATGAAITLLIELGPRSFIFAFPDPATDRGDER